MAASVIFVSVCPGCLWPQFHCSLFPSSALPCVDGDLPDSRLHFLGFHISWLLPSGGTRNAVKSGPREQPRHSYSSLYAQVMSQTASVLLCPNPASFRWVVPMDTVPVLFLGYPEWFHAVADLLFTSLSSSWISALLSSL